jgi:hypothetical protein
LQDILGFNFYLSFVNLAIQLLEVPGQCEQNQQCQENHLAILVNTISHGHNDIKHSGEQCQIFKPMKRLWSILSCMI